MRACKRRTQTAGRFSLGMWSQDKTRHCWDNHDHPLQSCPPFRKHAKHCGAPKPNPRLIRRAGNRAAVSAMQNKQNQCMKYIAMRANTHCATVHQCEQRPSAGTTTKNQLSHRTEPKQSLSFSSVVFVPSARDHF